MEFYKKQLLKIQHVNISLFFGYGGEKISKGWDWFCDPDEKIQFKKQGFFEGDGLQQGVIKNNHTHGIKGGRNHKKVSSFFVLKNHRDCQYLKAKAFSLVVIIWSLSANLLTKLKKPVSLMSLY